MARRLRSVVWWIAIGLSLILLPVWPFALALVWFDGLGGSTLSTLVFLAASALNVGFILRPVLAPAEAIVEAIARARAAR